MADLFLVDSHCHLDFPDFDADRDEVIARATLEGVGIMVTISTKVSRFSRIETLTSKYPNVFASVGTHPLSVAEENDISVSQLLEIAQHPKVVAIGEAGLDFHYDGAPADTQERVFRRHIEASRQSQLPLIIHSRDADTKMEHILVDEVGRGAFPFVLHCFTGGERLAEIGIELGGYLSFSGIAAFKSSEALRAIARSIPPERLLVETDAPYLAPPPFRGRRNEPSFVRKTAESLASAFEQDIEIFARQTTDNFFRLFSKVPDPRSDASF
ncbi:TatD family hydrolase [Aureimonas sp. ME7]|uniref:TatD family hydrolase n=1 Tax=Aureimonas sp. ME7 TaxID=2744252 RepID=UPI0015FBCB06|nr:TatD family hydrolase [Aureimonas sp. ME7]